MAVLSWWHAMACHGECRGMPWLAFAYLGGAKACHGRPWWVPWLALVGAISCLALVGAISCLALVGAISCLGGRHGIPYRFNLCHDASIHLEITQIVLLNSL
jgi:hypothetical protein